MKTLLAFLFFAAPLVAQSPLGTGYLGVDGSYRPGKLVQRVEPIANVWQTSALLDDFSSAVFYGRLPFGEAWSLGASLGIQQFGDRQVDSVSSPPVSGVTQQAMTRRNLWGMALQYNTGALADHGWRAGADMNPDGWIWWPSLELILSGNSYRTAVTVLGTPTGIFAGYTNDAVRSGTELNVGAELLWPLATNLSLGVVRYQQLSYAFDQVRNGSAVHVSGANSWSQLGMGLRFYHNFAAGQDKAHAQPWFPTLGPVGQARFNFDYLAGLDDSGALMFTTLSLGAATPLNGNLGLFGGLDLMVPEGAPLPSTKYELRDLNEWSFNLGVRWAWGDVMAVPEADVSEK